MQRHRVRARFCEFIDASVITRMHACRRYHAQTRMHVLLRASTLASTITRNHACRRCHSHACMYALSRASAQARTHALSRARTHAGAITRKRARTRYHARARLQALSRASTHADHDNTVTAYEALQHRYTALSRYTDHLATAVQSICAALQIGKYWRVM